MAASWAAAYEGIFPVSFLGHLTAGKLARFWQDQLQADGTILFRADGVVLVAQTSAGVAGFAVVGPRSDPAEGELVMLYVDPGRWHVGVGSALNSSCVVDLRARGFRSAHLSVVQQNQRARLFYEANGWTVSGPPMVNREYGFDLVEVPYSRALDAS